MEKDIEMLIQVCMKRIEDNNNFRIKHYGGEFFDGVLKGKVSAYEEVVEALKLIIGE